jgi:ABC-type glutathione transport system ATPase component
MNLKQCLSENRLTISGLAKHLNLSIASVSLITNKSQFPKTGDTEAIKNEIQNYLNLMGIKQQISWNSVAADDQQENGDKEMLSQTARKFFGFFRTPFDGDVEKASDVFQNSETRFIREAMFQTAKNGGLLAVIGESGAGKSTLRRDLIDRCA